MRSRARESGSAWLALNHDPAAHAVADAAGHVRVQRAAERERPRVGEHVARRLARGDRLVEGPLAAVRDHVVIDYVGKAATGVTVAAPSFKHVAEQLIQYLDIKPAQHLTGGWVAMQGGVR